jgi:hypothetical protein
MQKYLDSQYLKASFILAPDCLMLTLARSTRPSVRTRSLGIARPRSFLFPSFSVITDRGYGLAVSTGGGRLPGPLPVAHRCRLRENRSGSGLLGRRIAAPSEFALELFTGDQVTWRSWCKNAVSRWGVGGARRKFCVSQSAIRLRNLV